MAYTHTATHLGAASQMDMDNAPGESIPTQQAAAVSGGYYEVEAERFRQMQVDTVTARFARHKSTAACVYPGSGETDGVLAT